MKTILLAPLLLAAVEPSAADDFASRWEAIEPPTMGVMVEMPAKPHAVRVERIHHCHRIWFTRNNHRSWRCER
jgi:hypothetical protein